MKIKKFYLAFNVIVLATTVSNAQTNFKTLFRDFQNLSGSWTGSLTYLDYSSGKPYTMPADVEIKRIGTTNQFALSNLYPNEPNANSTNTVTISTDGKYINKELVKSRRTLPSGGVEIITEEAGTDGNERKPATVRHIYLLGKTIFKKRKDVQFVGETNWLNRHEYAYTKKPGR